VGFSVIFDFQHTWWINIIKIGSCIKEDTDLQAALSKVLFKYYHNKLSLLWLTEAILIQFSFINL
jgi:hypothetical protein